MSLSLGIELQLFGMLLLLATGAWYWAQRQIALWRQRNGLPIWKFGKRPLLPGNPHALPYTGGALANPPGDFQATLQALQENAPSSKFRIPIGWSLVDGRAALSQAALVRDINHVLITAQSDGGKDNWALGALISLAAVHPPTEVQFGILDGKGLDFAGWEAKAHTWRLALTPESIEPMMRAVSAERRRRGDILRNAGVSKWDAYQGGDVPLLVIYISELSLLQDATSKSTLEQWLNSELAAGRAFGIRYLIATQTASHFATRWRSQISLYLAGFQPSQSQDAPNTGLTTREIQQAGGVPPSLLPPPPQGAGVFCAIYGRDAVTVRTSFIDDAQRRRWLNLLPARVGTSSLLPQQSGVEAGIQTDENTANDTLPPSGSAEAPLVSPEEYQAILTAAQIEPSRRKVCQRVFRTTGGRAWEKVKQVCDHAGLLLSEPGGA